MEEEIRVIAPKRSYYGRLQVTLPKHIKTTILGWSIRSGMKRAEFLRTSLMIGAAELAERIKAKGPDEGYG